ncbi:MAG: polysaccharide deacetylase family protein [candidate division Zixibacteria bacterium]|nr:polysaccharide deacetylase family protein [candidate division Zixibacteria bacterium]
MSPVNRVVVVALALVLFVVLVGGQSGNAQEVSKKKADKKICLTFDELPASRSFQEVDREAINYLILQALRAHKVKAAGFVVGEQIQGFFDGLGEWLNDGHTLGNLTYTGQDYNQLGPQQFIRDIEHGFQEMEPMLAGFGQKKRYFRYPYLHYGETVEARRAVSLFLEDRDYVVCPATVVPEDYLYNLTLEKLGKEPDSARYEQLMNDYVNHVLDELVRVENLAQELVGRRVAHILQLRANRLNAVYLEDMLTALEAAGYEFVSLDTALKDKLYSMPEAYYGMKGLGYLDMIYYSNPDLLPAEN